MKELNVKHLFDGLIHLDSISIEINMEDAPIIDMFNDNIFIDLSKCQFAELGALTQLVLIIESFIKKNHNVFIALPSTKLTKNQLESDRGTSWSEKSLEKQKATTNFIKKTGFISILQKLSKLYENEIYFTEEYDYARKGEKINIETFTDTFSVLYEEIAINDANYKFLLPFKLIDCERGFEEVKDFENSLDKVLQNQERGIESFDVKVIKNVILSELIKNVRYHAESTKYAIFVVGLINSNSIIEGRKFKKSNPIEEKHIKYINEYNIESQVEIYFGDSGIGLLNEKYIDNINKTFHTNNTNYKELLKLSFNKWSTIQDNEPRRGTKGLYRLRRIVDKYKGIVHIRTSNSNGGFFNGDFEYRKSNQIFNGTLISIRLNPYKEIKSFKLSSSVKFANNNWISEKIEVDENLICINEIREKILNENNLLLLTDISKINLSIASKIIESFLYEISFISHPSAIVIYLINNQSSIDNDTIELLTESVQTRINKSNNDSETPDFEEVHDPVLVIGNNNQTFWYGGSENLIKIINESYFKISESGNISIKDLTSFNNLSLKEQIDIQNYLAIDNSLVVLNNKEEIEFNFYGIENHYEKKIRDFNPKIRDKNICTPKLNVINKWIDILELLQDDEYGFALCLYIKYRKKIELGGGDISFLDKKGTFILIEHNQQLKLTKKFAELIGLKNKNIRNIEEEIDYTLPKRTKLFNDNSNVIFLTTIVSSSETIRRMVKYAKRDLANPEVILCLINYRKNKISRLETWNDTTSIISIFQKYNIESDPIIRDDNYFDKKIKELKTAEILINQCFDEAIEDPLLSHPIKVDEQLLDFIKENKFLHYNHYGQNNKRHFTFYLDKKGILNSAHEIIFSKIEETISRWIYKKKTDNYILYVNHSLIYQNERFLKFLNERFPKRIRAIDIRKDRLNESNSIYFDFGILTGESINSLINKVENVDNLLVCLLFNQSINNNANIYKKIDTLKFKLNTTLIPTEDNQYSKTVNFEITYLYNLPLSFFNSETCPICEHRKALDYYKLDESYFIHFSDDRRERLKQNSADDIYDLEYPVDFYYSDKEDEKKQEMSKEIIFQMYEFKTLLGNAAKYTRCRIELFELIYNLYLNIEDELKDSESNIYSILYYLSHEINWLQIEPLAFRDFRILLSKISLRIASINTQILITHFDYSNKYKISSVNLATRYKYSAISVLRSTDKLLFCQNIFNIVKSTIIENNRFSNNLLQNTLYHISSFFKNTYNNSELYFLEIDNNLNQLIKEYLGFPENQISAIKYILGRNREKLIFFMKIEDEPIAFKKMKEQWKALYVVDMPRHPEPYQELKGLSLEQHESTFIAIKENPDLEEERSLLIRLIKQLPSHLKNVQNYISNNILFYFSEKLPSLKKSKYFNDEFNNYFDSKEVNSKIDRLSEIIDLMNRDLLEYITHKEEFNSIYNLLSDNLIIKKNIGGSTRNSKFIDLLNDFPLSITSTIDDVFSAQEFPNRQIICSYKDVKLTNYSNIKVYFSKSIFKRHLEYVKDNLKQKLNSNVLLSSTKLNFEIEISDGEFVKLRISYNNTDKWLAKPNPDGSLKTFKKHIEDFGGKLDYIPCALSKEFFEINIKFLRYE